MKIFETTKQWVSFREQALRLEPTEVNLGFVPTMGALHEGHLSLIRKSQKENSKTLVSIFINPTQFNNLNDFEQYPQAIPQDLQLLENEDVDYVLLPKEDDIYPDGNNIVLTENSDLSKVLCGAHRPGHFDGVLTVMNKLLNLARASKCYMGEKDYQQLMLVKALVVKFFIPTEIVACPTLREDSGLAMSSRNLRLSTEAKSKAAIIYKLLSSKSDLNEIKQNLISSGFEIDYVEKHWGRKFVAAHIDGLRLIDNV